MDSPHKRTDIPGEEALIHLGGSTDLSLPIGDMKDFLASCSEAYYQSGGDIELVERFIVASFEDAGIEDFLAIQTVRAHAVNSIGEWYGAKTMPDDVLERAEVMERAHFEFVRDLHERNPD